MKKFGSGDIIYNKIKAYPKVRFFANSGSISYNNDTDNGGNAVLFDFLRGISTTPPEIDCALITEEEAIIYTENDGYLLIENCGDLNFLLAEDGQVLLDEIGTAMAPE